MVEPPRMSDERRAALLAAAAEVFARYGYRKASMDDVARAAGLSRLVQVFGSSETAGLGWRDDETAPYRCFPYWQGPDRDGSMLRHMMDGTTASFTVQDELVWKDSRHFLPQGRRDEVVQVGGRNVSPAHVAQVLRRHPRVQDASVQDLMAVEGISQELAQTIYQALR